jgi:dihydroorotase
MLTHVNDGKLTLAHFVSLMTLGPRKIFGLQNKGVVEVGGDADFTIVNLSQKKVIEKKWLASKSGWSPLEGFEAHGWPVGTIIRGRWVTRDEELLNKAFGRVVEFK